MTYFQEKFLWPNILLVIAACLVSIMGCSSAPPSTLATGVFVASPTLPRPTSILSSEPATVPVTIIPQIPSSISTLASVQVSTLGGFGNSPVAYPIDWSADGKILFYTLQDTVRTLRLANLQYQVLVTVPNAQLGGVYYAPSGKYLAIKGLQHDEQLGLDADIIWVTKIDGTNLRNLTQPLRLAPIAKFIHQWVGDEQLAFSIWGGNGIRRIYTAEMSNGEIDTILKKPSGCGVIGGDYFFSPNRLQLAIDSLQTQVAWLSLNSPEQCKKLVDTEFLPRQKFQGWFPDSNRFLYTEYENGDPDLGVYSSAVSLRVWDISTNTFTKLLDGVATASPSPDGTKVAFLRQKNSEWDYARLNGLNVNQSDGVTALELGVLDLTSNQVNILKAAGYKPEENSDVSLRYWQLGKPVWSPDGKLLAYWGDDGNAYLVSFDGSWRQQLTNDLEIVQFLWSPDASKLAFRTMNQAWIIENPKK